MTDDDIIDAGKALSQATIRFLVRNIKKYPYASIAERDAIILCAAMRIVISKIIHRSKTKYEADLVFFDFVTSLTKSWNDQEFIEERKNLH